MYKKVFLSIVFVAVTALALQTLNVYAGDDYDKKDDYTKEDKKDDYTKEDEEENKKDDYDKKDDYTKEEQSDDYEKTDDYTTEESDDYVDVSGVRVIKTKTIRVQKTDNYDKEDYSGAEYAYGVKIEDDYEGYIDDKDGKKEARQIIVNSDGTTTEIRRKVEDDGEIKVRYILKDAEGNKIEERVGEYDKEEGEGEMKITKYDVYGNKINEIKIKTKDGKSLAVFASKGNEVQNRVKYDSINDAVIIATDGEFDDEAEGNQNKITVRAGEKGFLITRSGYAADTALPLKIDSATGEVFVQTQNGEVKLGVMPDAVVNMATASDDALGVIDTVKIVSDENGTVYKVEGKKFEKLFGIFTSPVTATLNFDAQSGEFVGADQSFWSKTIDLFSF